MKYIEKLILENFQSHKHTIIEFDSQLNVIVGPSDSGKTAILRGIRWVLFNEPSGDYFIREGESECSVTIAFNDGTKIKRYRSKNKNIYLLYDSNNNEMKFEGFGTSVPQEIIEATGIKKILLDSDLSKSINLSDQLEGAFLLSERSSTRSSSIGRLVGVNIIDDALRETLRDSRNLSSNKRLLDDSIVELEKELIKYEYLDELNIRINEIELIRKNIYEKSNRLSKYKKIYEKLSILFQEKKETNYYLEKLGNIEEIYNLLNLITLKVSHCNYLTTQSNLISRLSLNKQQNINIVNSLKYIHKAENNIQNITLLYNLEIKLIDCKSKLQKIKHEIKELNIISSKLKDLDTLQNNINKIHNYINELKNLISIKDREFSLRKSLALGEKYVEKLNEVHKISNIHMDLQDKIILLNRLKKLENVYNLNESEIKNTNDSLSKYNNEIKFQLSQYKEILLKQETCPLCFSNIDNDKINHIISHYK